MKKFLISLITISSFILNGQEIKNDLVFEETASLSGRGFSSLIYKNGEPRLMTIHKQGINIIDINSGKLINSFELKGYHNKELLGYSYTDELLLFFKEDPLFEIILTVSKTNRVRKVPANAAISEDEIFLNSFTTNGQFYILTITRKSSTLNLHSFKSFALGEKKSYDLSEYFPSGSLFKELKKRRGENAPPTLGGLPPAITLVKDQFTSLYEISKLSKLYIDDASAIITLDNGLKTDLIQLDLNSLKFSFKSLKSFTECTYSNSLIKNNASNSMVNGNEIWMCKVCREAMHVSRSNLGGSNEVSWKYEIDKDQGTSPVYTPIGAITKKKLKAISNRNVGVIAQKIGDEELLLIGGYITKSAPIPAPSGVVFFSVNYSDEESVLLSGVRNMDNSDDRKFEDNPFIKVNNEIKRMKENSHRYIYPFQIMNDIYISYYESSEKLFKIIKYKGY